MRVFRKRQLRLREEDNSLHVYLDNPNSEYASANTTNISNFTKNTGSKVTAEFRPSGVSPKGVVSDDNTNVGAVTQKAKDANRNNYSYAATFSNGRPGSGTTKESRFSDNLIEGAVMFSKRELRDFLRKL